MIAVREPPSCLAGLRVLSAGRSSYAADQGNSFILGCKCGGTVGRVVGHWLDHPDRPGEAVFVGPLSYACQSCGDVTPFLDTAKHGYDALLGGDYNLRGEGSAVPFDDTFGQIRFEATYQIEDLQETAMQVGVPPSDLFDTCCVSMTRQGGGDDVLVADFECA